MNLLALIASLMVYVDDGIEWDFDPEYNTPIYETGIWIP
jgi:hypothetical protein